MQVLRFFLLGSFQVTQTSPMTGCDEPLTGFGYKKVRALLAYLAVEHDFPHSRERLGTLFWPDADESTARTNLRKALSNLRKTLDAEGSEPYLIIHNDTVQFNPQSSFWLDVDQLKTRLDAMLQHTHLLFESCVSDLEEAVSLYRGSFLQGLEVNSLDFEEWLLTLRENLHTRMLSALYELTQYYLSHGEYALAQKHALRLVELEPYSEEGHRAIMESLACSGLCSAALAQYERCRKILTEELGLKPGSETEKLYQRIRSAGNVRPQNLPVQQKMLIGRHAERREIGKLLANPECRLLTLVGMGGIGKTSLALQVASENVESFWHGAFWISLEQLQKTDQIPAAILGSLSVNLGSDPEKQLVDYLRDKSILLILDNFEQLVSPANDGGQSALQFLNNILENTRQVKLLVTSRERLCLRAEWVYPLEGLPFPQDNTSEKDADLLRFAAVQLFIRRARQTAPVFPRREDDYQQISRICKLVGGIPLGIELASGRVDHLSCKAIADRIEADLDFLVTSLWNIPDRHQSLRVVFEYSWEMFSKELQAILCKIAIFQNPFDQEAARETAQAQPFHLGLLVNKSFLSLNAEGLYTMHLLLKQFLVEKLAEDANEEQNTRRKHALHMIRFLKKREKALTVQFQTTPLDEVERRIGDVRAAWEWAVYHKEMENLDDLLESVFIYFWARNRFSEGLNLLESAVIVVNTLAPSHRNRLLLARFQSRCADFIYWLGDLGESRRLLQESINVLYSLEAHQELAYALELSSRIANWHGGYEQAKKDAAAAIEFARLSGQKHLLAQALSSLANTICDDSGDYVQAESLYAESLVIYHQLENPFGIAKVLINQGAICFERGEYKKAQNLYQESLQYYRELDYSYGISVCLNNLATIARKSGECEQAQALIGQSLALKRETGNRVAIIHSLLEIGALNIEMENFAQARTHYNEALQISFEIQTSVLIFCCVLGFAEFYEKTGNLMRAVELVKWVLAQENNGQESRIQAEGMNERLEVQLSAEDIAVCEQRAASLNIDHLFLTLMQE